MSEPLNERHVDSSEIVIRPYREGDASRLFEAATESIREVHPWLPWCHPGYSIAESDAWVEHSMGAWGEGRELNFVVEDRSQRFLGGCGINQRVASHRVANLGYWVRTSATRRGVATAAVQLVAEYAFAHTDLLRLEIVVAIENVASLRVMEKTWAVKEGTAHDRLFLHGRSHDAVVYALLRSRLRPTRIGV